MSKELNPCPFCEGELRVLPYHDEPNLCDVKCQNEDCFFVIEGLIRHGIENYLNTRPGEDKAAEAASKLAGYLKMFLEITEKGTVLGKKPDRNFIADMVWLAREALQAHKWDTQ